MSKKKTQARWAIEAYIDAGGEMPATKQQIVDWICENSPIEIPSREVLAYRYVSDVIGNELREGTIERDGIRAREFISAPTPVLEDGEKKIRYLWDTIEGCSRRHATRAFNHMRKSVASDIESLNNSIRFYNENNNRARGKQLELFPV